MKIQEQINNLEKELDNPEINKQRKRHLEDELDSLVDYANHYPNAEECPNAFQLYCYKNPDCPECKIFDL
jgi:hypothetical protein